VNKTGSKVTDQGKTKKRKEGRTGTASRAIPLARDEPIGRPPPSLGGVCIWLTGLSRLVGREPAQKPVVDRKKSIVATGGRREEGRLLAFQNKMERGFAF
jgi:hypothetical protein